MKHSKYISATKELINDIKLYVYSQHAFVGKEARDAAIRIIFRNAKRKYRANNKDLPFFDCLDECFGAYIERNKNNLIKKQEDDYVKYATDLIIHKSLKPRTILLVLNNLPRADLAEKIKSNLILYYLYISTLTKFSFPYRKVK